MMSATPRLDVAREWRRLRWKRCITVMIWVVMLGPAALGLFAAFAWASFGLAFRSAAAVTRSLAGP